MTEKKMAYMISQILPPWAVAMLMAAAKTGEKGSFERASAIDFTTDRIKRLIPQYFRTEL